MPTYAMDTIQTRPPQTIAAWVDDKAMQLAQDFIVQLKNHDDRFVYLQIRNSAVASTTLNEAGSNNIRKNEILIRARLREPCAHAKAEQAFKELINDMELAGYTSRFSPDELYRPELDTAGYLLSFRKKENVS